MILKYRIDLILISFVQAFKILSNYKIIFIPF